MRAFDDNVNFVNEETYEQEKDESLSFTYDVVDENSSGSPDEDLGGRLTKSFSMNTDLEM